MLWFCIVSLSSAGNLTSVETSKHTWWKCDGHLQFLQNVGNSPWDGAINTLASYPLHPLSQTLHKLLLIPKRSSVGSLEFFIFSSRFINSLYLKSLRSASKAYVNCPFSFMYLSWPATMNWLYSPSLSSLRESAMACDNFFRVSSFYKWLFVFL